MRILLLGVLVNLALVGHSTAWTSHPQPFPSGEATVVHAYHCWADQYCHYTTGSEWEAEIQDAVQAWNEAGSNFRFQTRGSRADDDPCRNTSEHIFVILSDLSPEHVCPQDRPIRGTLYAAFQYGSGWGRLYVNTIALTYSTLPQLLLLHELGHALGLGHPNEAGQTVDAVMNTGNLNELLSYSTLQLDDIEGAQAIWGVRHIKRRLENPGNGKHYSGIGVISGWQCAEGRLTIRFNDGPLIPLAYGTERTDTRQECGHTTTGFVSIYNWARLGDGQHIAVLYNNGVEVVRSRFTVGTAGTDFVEGVQTSVTVQNFPEAGDQQLFEWNQNTQHMEMVSPHRPHVTATGSQSPGATLENPGHELNYSGIGVISGWKCAAVRLTARINGGTPIPLLYGNERQDTQPVCGHTATGFIAIYNWGRLGDGQHEVVVYDGEVEFARSTFTVGTTGEVFLRGAEALVTVRGIPFAGQTMDFRWVENSQHLEMAGRGVEPPSTGGFGIEMVLIPAGTFQMGSPASEPGRDSFEEPVHQVTIRQPFYLGKYEVTQAQWRAVMGTNPSRFSNCDTCPVDSVSWNDIQVFLEELNRKEQVHTYRMPTEAEWEYAARAGTSTAYNFGAEERQLGRYAWYADNAGGRTHPVGGKRPNAFGLYDVHGNASEWVQDCWNEKYTGAPTDGGAWLTGRCNIRVLRGGSWNSHARSLRSADRSRDLTRDSHEGQSGFRLARSVN